MPKITSAVGFSDRRALGRRAPHKKVSEIVQSAIRLELSEVARRKPRRHRESGNGVTLFPRTAFDGLGVGERAARFDGAITHP
jgi:hypothetical protein